MANEIRKFPFLVPPSTKVGSGGGTATESPKKEVQDATVDTNTSVSDVASTRIESEPVQVAANVRLVIEKNEVSGGYIYKSIDGNTGEVIQQFPREEILRVIAASRAAEGMIIDTEA